MPARNFAVANQHDSRSFVLARFTPHSTTNKPHLLNVLRKRSGKAGAVASGMPDAT
jgi:hypothetical protein